MTLPIKVIVYNGSDPQTLINNKIYNSRNITAYFTYTTWSSDPIANSTTIVTYDHIQIANYTIERTWYAGKIEIIPLLNLNTQQDWNTINYYLTFNVQSDLVQPPPWISQKIIYSKSAVISWFYLEQNATLAHTLYNYIMKTINKTDFQYWKFEYFVLASQFVMYTFNTTSSVFTNLLELESFYENWSLVTASILNLSAWPKLQYFNYQIMFFNVSRITQIYNNTIFMNITGNYEIYLVDIYNALYYGGFNKVPFGNIYYYFNPLNNETTYFYLNTTGQHIPYLHETLCFTSANYIPNIFYATFQYTAAVKTEIIAIWNGTVWKILREDSVIHFIYNKYSGDKEEALKIYDLLKRKGILYGKVETRKKILLKYLSDQKLKEKLFEEERMKEIERMILLLNIRDFEGFSFLDLSV